VLGFFNVFNRRALLVSALALGSKAMAQPSEIRLALRPIRLQDLVLYVLEAQIEGIPTTLIVDTFSPLGWLDPRQGHQSLAQRLGPAAEVRYPDGGWVTGPGVDLSWSLGTWQQKSPILLAKTLNGPAEAGVQWVKRYLAQGFLGIAPGKLTGLKRLSLTLGNRPALLLDPLIYPATFTLPLNSDGTVLLGQEPRFVSRLDSSSPYIWLKPSAAERLGVRPEDLSPTAMGTVKAVNRLLKLRLGALVLRFNPPRVLVAEHPIDIILGVPFFEQATVTWDLSTQQLYVGDAP